MNAGKHKLCNKYDIFLFAALIVFALIIYIILTLTYGRGSDKIICEIKLYGKTVKTVDLSESDFEFELPDNPNIRFKLINNAIAFIESDCPDKICVNTGYINRSGQSAVCLPNRVSIHIISTNGSNEIEKEKELDIVVP